MVNTAFLTLLTTLLLNLTFNSIAIAGDVEPCNELGVEALNWQSSNQQTSSSGVVLNQVKDGCFASKLDLKVGDVVVGVNGQEIRNYEDFYKLTSAILVSDAYEFSLLNQTGELRKVRHEATKQKVMEETQYIKPQLITGGWLVWLGWFIFFIIFQILSPFILRLLQSNDGRYQTFFTASALVGAANTPRGGNYFRSAFQGLYIANAIILGIALLGIWGVLYCTHHLTMAFSSDASKTYCCAETFLGKTDISKISISADGRWLVSVRETPTTFPILGNKVVPEHNAIAAMDLNSGQYVRWPETKSKWLGFETSLGSNDNVKDIVIDNGLFIKPTEYVTEESWVRVNRANDIFTPINNINPNNINIQYQVSNIENGLFQITNVSNGTSTTLDTKFNFDKYYVSPDGRVLALVQAYADKPDRTDGIATELYKMASNAISQSWTIEFWDIANKKKISSFKGHGINDEAWKNTGIPDTISTLNFLESSSDGRLWYMIKADGIIHVFDLKNKIPLVIEAKSPESQQHIFEKNMDPLLLLYKPEDDHGEVIFDNLESFTGTNFELLQSRPELLDAINKTLGNQFEVLTKEFSISQDIKHLDDGSLILTYCKYYNCQNGSLVISVQSKGFVSAFLYDEPKQDGTGTYTPAMPRHQLFTSNEYPIKVSASFNDFIRDVLHYNLSEF